MKLTPGILFLLLYFTGHYLLLAETDYTSWKFSSLSSIGSVDISPEGAPKIITINGDSAFFFDGVDDRVDIRANPLIGLDEFTLEAVFRVDKGGSAEQKFFHLQASPDIRILFELEFTTDTTWYLESFIQNASGESIHLMDASKLHPVDRWFHAAVVCKDGEFTLLINYKTENTQSLIWTAPTDGSVSVGARMNKVNYLKGAVREIRFANAALDSSQFLFNAEMLEQSETFVLDNLEKINGYDVQVFGNPRVVETEIGPGIDFDGVQDGIYVNTNPLGPGERFTIETIIKPNDVYPNNWEPRYLHIEGPSNSNRRLTMELRLNDNHEWYFDGFLKSESGSLGLINENLTHPVEGWEHIAVTYGNGIFKTYVNRINELSGSFEFLPISSNARMSLGMRMNNRAYFNGIIQKVRVTHAVLDTAEFMAIYPDTSGNHTAVERGVPHGSGLEVTVFPNPTRDRINLRVQTPEAQNIVISFFTLSGVKLEEVYNGSTRGGINHIELEVGDRPKGIYILKLVHNSGVETQNIALQ